MTNSKSTLLSQSGSHGNALEAKIFASRPGICTVTKIPDHFEGVAVKVTTTDAFGDADFVVRSVRAGRGRKIEVLFGQVPAALATAIEGYQDLSENQCDRFEADSYIWLRSGNQVALLSDAVQVTV
ncbi:MAG: hypothetical protein K8F91_13720 [Candidatus Obscuribacterales bacterium]|nr:hypothetical protein [Candidatus Obscuribacterales bacterium]